MKCLPAMKRLIPGRLWVPKTLSDTINLDFRLHETGDEDGAWHSLSSVLPSSVSSNWSVSPVMDKRTWPSRSSSSAKSLPSCADRWRVRPCSQRTEQYSLD
jgi:hypothetical protein